MTSKRISQPSADSDLRATVLLAARRAEANPRVVDKPVEPSLSWRMCFAFAGAR
jgi:hypothetical protein